MAVGNNHRLSGKTRRDVATVSKGGGTNLGIIIPIIETEIWKVNVVVNKGLYLFLRTIGEEKVGDSGNLDSPNTTIDKFIYHYGRVICSIAFCNNIAVGFLFSAVSGTECIPMFS